MLWYHFQVIILVPECPDMSQGAKYKTAAQTVGLRERDMKSKKRERERKALTWFSAILARLQNKKSLSAPKENQPGCTPVLSRPTPPLHPCPYWRQIVVLVKPEQRQGAILVRETVSSTKLGAWSCILKQPLPSWIIGWFNICQDGYTTLISLRGDTAHLGR